MAKRRKTAVNRGWFLKGNDPRRHQLTHAEKQRGGRTTARKYTVCGRWHLDWYDRWSTLKKGAS